jgi:RNA polymerase sigma-70 factor (ECF subfamily)
MGMARRQESDEQLMAAVAGGDRGEAMERLVRRYGAPLLTFIRRMIGDAERSEDLFQEVFVAVWRHRRTYRFPRPFRPWLYRIAINQCRSSFRRKSLPITGGATDYAVEAQPAATNSPVEVAVATETAATVEQAVMRLPDKQRAVVVMRNWNGLSYAEIAVALDLNESTARVHMHHALANLRNALEGRI